MKKVYVNAENLDALQSLLDEGEGKASARTLSAQGVIKWAKLCDEELPVCLLPKKSRRGIIVIIQPAYKLPSSYQWRADSTTVWLEYGPKGWRLIDAKRGPNNESVCNEVNFILPESVAVEARARFEKTFTVSG